MVLAGRGNRRGDNYRTEEK